MPKVSKLNNRLYVPLPADLIAALGISEGEELEFFRHNDKSFVIAKKNDLLDLLEGAKTQQEKQKPQQVSEGDALMDQKSLFVLKKLDTLRYNDRTKDKVNSILDPEERKVLQALMDRKVVKLYRKDPNEQYKYSIPKDIYDKFLFGKRAGATAKQPQQPAPPPARQQQPQQQPQEKKRWDENYSQGYLNAIEANGYLVLRGESDASAASAELEESIKRGLIIGTRAFDKKFYICMKGFVVKNAPRVTKALDGDKPVSLTDISESLKMEPDAVKAILYMLAESGEVTEVRKDIFKLV